MYMHITQEWPKCNSLTVFILPSVCLSARCLSACLHGVCLPVCTVSACLSAWCLSASLHGVCLPVCMVSVSLSPWCLSACLHGVCLSVCMVSVCLSAWCLSASLHGVCLPVCMVSVSLSAWSLPGVATHVIKCERPTERRGGHSTMLRASPSAWMKAGSSRWLTSRGKAAAPVGSLMSVRWLETSTLLLARASSHTMFTVRTYVCTYTVLCVIVCFVRMCVYDACCWDYNDLVCDC